MSFPMRKREKREREGKRKRERKRDERETAAQPIYTESTVRFAICTPEEWRGEWSVAEPRRLERKLTTPSLFFLDVNFIATSRLFTDRSVPAPDSECRLSWLPEFWRSYPEDRDTARHEGKASMVDTCMITLLSLSLSPLLFFSFHFSPLHSVLVSVLIFAHIFHSSFNISFHDSPFHANSRLRAIPFLRISHFYATPIRLRNGYLLYGAPTRRYCR